METLKVDTKGLRGGPIEWTKDNHFRTSHIIASTIGTPVKIGHRSRQGLVRLRREIDRSVSQPRRELLHAWRGRDSFARRVFVVQLAVNIVVLAAIYALIACGYVLIYRVSRVLNLAHGELMMLGAYLLLTTASLFTAILAALAIAAVVLSLVVGVLVYVFLMRKMTGEMVLAAVLTTVALGILLRGLDGADLVGAAAVSGAGARLHQSVTRAAGRRAHLAVRRGAGGRRQRSSMARCLSFLRFGRWGMRMRAAGQNPLLAAQRGINLHARLRAGLGPLDADRRACRHADRARFRARPDHGRHRPQGLSGRAGRRARQPRRRAARRADRGRRPKCCSIHYVDPLLSDVVPFLVLIAMLVVRPWGLFGTREELDRV